MLPDGTIINSDGRVAQAPSVMTKASAVRKMLFSLDLKAEYGSSETLFSVLDRITLQSTSC